MDKRQFLKGSVALTAMTSIHEGHAPAQNQAQTHATSVPRDNWAGTFHYHTDRVLQPTSVEEVSQAIRSVASVRALGTRHSFNGIADSSFAQLSTLALNDFKLDTATRTLTVGSGIKYGDLAKSLDQSGFALANMASLPHISVGGSIATATHGSGLRNGNLATSVSGIEFVAADGSVHTLTRARDGETFKAAVVGLGSLGIVTHITLDVEPTYDMTQIVYQGLDFHELEHNFEAIMSTGYSLSLFTNWQHHQAWEVWIKRRVDQGGGEPPPPTFYGATLATEKLHPVKGQDPEKTTDQMNLVGKWFERLPHFKMEFTPSTGREIQTEYFVPFESAYDAVLAVESLRDRITPHLFVTELRSIAADDLWLSMAYHRRSLAIHFTWKPEWDAVKALLPVIEAKLRPFSPRPHWGKVNTLRAAEISPLYPRMLDFRQLMRQYDPHGKFLNPFMHDEVLGSSG